MRVVQIIDSLDVGGAERMAVNYANALAKKINFSGLIATRKEGSLLPQMNKKVSYFFLKKQNSFDLSAIVKLRKYIKRNEIEIVHAHSSSYFIAVLVKLTFPKIKIIWHDHYGARVRESRKQNKVLILFSFFFSSIVVVNPQLAQWSRKHMFCKKVLFIPNFSLNQEDSNEVTKLLGENEKRIVFLANLKNPKNHILVLKAFVDLKLNDLGWSLHLIGKDYMDSYSEVLKKIIATNSLQNNIHLYGEKNDIRYILSQATIGVLASTSEGFPVTLLEYGLAKLPVISTNAGYCSDLIKNNYNGLLFDPTSDFEFRQNLQTVIGNLSLQKFLGDNLNNSVIRDYSEKIAIEKLISIYKNKISEK